MESNTGQSARIVAAVAAIAGLASSAALLAPYLVRGGFCAPGGGCDAVAQSGYSTLFGVPLPFLGVLGFTALLAFVIWRGAGARRLAPFVALPFIVAGVRLLAIQAFVLHRFCPFCVVIDLGSIAAGVALLVEWRTVARDRERPWLKPSVATPSAMIAFTAPLLIAASRPAATTQAIAPVENSAGRVVLREFVDLECPYCRVTHVALKQALAGRPDVVVERRHVPLPSHAHAMPAAIAACCAAEQGAEEAFVDAVVASPSDPDAALGREVAAKLGLDLAKFDACRASDRPKKRIDTDVALYESTHVPGLPTIDIGGERHIGALDPEGARALLARHEK
ncbi:MAG: thioredoxin domain-containing protein [Deltaproteobacteria bacterium]|nr:thioredoxin domain-containing protein [Deltaproteobacteria bacterium]